MWDDEITVVALDFVLGVYWLGWIGKVHKARDIFFGGNIFGKVHLQDKKGDYKMILR